MDRETLVGYSLAIILTFISVYWIKEYIFAQNILLRNSLIFMLQMFPYLNI